MINRIKHVLLIFLIGLMSLQVVANKQMSAIKPLSKSSYIALLTCDPGSQLYSTFGHSAIGVVDKEQDLNLIFNYGTFSFNVPFFYSKFMSGKLLYKLSITSYNRFLSEYRYEKRRVIEEKLNLTQQQQQKLFNILQENYKPENREYQYDFFFDNCSTRILDIFYTTLGDSLTYVLTKNPEVKTLRNLLSEYLKNGYWSNFGISIILGSVIDKQATELQKVFLPDYLSKYVNHCVINGKPLIVSSKELVSESLAIPSTPWLVRPIVIFWFLFFIITLFTVFKYSKNWIITDKIIFGTIGIIGLIILFFWIGSEHDATGGNLNVLWANPLYFIYIWLIGTKHRKILKWWSIAIASLNIIVLMGWSIIPQQYHLVFIPIIGVLILRSMVIALHNLKI